MIDLKFTINRGDFTLSIDEQFDKVITGIYGPSGAGKTSLLKIISGILQPSSGFVKINDSVLFDTAKKINIPIENREVAYVFQEGRLFPHLNVEQNLRYGIKKDVLPIIDFETVVKILDIGDLLNRSTSSISGGQRQRVALGRALLSSPKVLLLDEPFSALDRQLRGQIIPYLIDIQNRIRIPVLVVSHDSIDLLKLTKKICVIDKGRVLGHGGYTDLIKDKIIAKYLHYDSAY